MKKPVWRNTAVRIVVGPDEKPGEATVAGAVCDAAPGLAVSRSFSDEPRIGTWSVTHVPSGRVLADGLSAENARRVALAIVALADWTETVPVPKSVNLLPVAVAMIADSRRKPFRPL